MYFPIGWPQTLAKSQAIHQIVANIDQTLFILLSFDSISIWYCRPVVQIVRYQRTAKSIHDYGTNVAAVWKSDSSQIVVQTSTSYLLFYNVVISDDNDTVLNLIEPRYVLLFAFFLLVYISNSTSANKTFVMRVSPRNRRCPHCFSIYIINYLLKRKLLGSDFFSQKY